MAARIKKEDEDIFKCYCEQMDNKYNKLIKVIYGLVIAIMGAGALQFITFGEVKAQVIESKDQLEFINKNYVPTIFLDGFIQNQNYETQEIVATIHGDPEKVKEVCEKYLRFQKTMINQMIEFRGGITPTTRSLQAQPKTITEVRKDSLRDDSLKKIYR
jgi:hypothetical protein